MYKTHIYSKDGWLESGSITFPASAFEISNQIKKGFATFWYFLIEFHILAWCFLCNSSQSNKREQSCEIFMSKLFGRQSTNFIIFRIDVNLCSIAFAVLKNHEEWKFNFIHFKYSFFSLSLSEIHIIVSPNPFWRWKSHFIYFSGLRR